ERGWWSGLILLLRPSGVGKCKSNATAASGSSLRPKVIVANIKLEPLYEEDISVKDEPIDIDENQAGSREPPSPGCGGQLAPPSPSAASGSSLSPKVVAANIKIEPLYEEEDISVKDEPIDIDELAPPPPSGWPDKMEAQIEAREAHVAHRPASLSSTMPGHVNVGRRQSAPAGDPEDAGDSGGVSEASSSQQCSEILPYSQRGLVDAKVTCQMQQRHPDEQASSNLYSCFDCEYSCGSELQLLKHIHVLHKHSSKKPLGCSESSPGGSKVKSEALEQVESPLVLPASVIYIKEEPEDKTEEVSIKEEPFLYGNENAHITAATSTLFFTSPQSCSTEHLSPALTPSSCVPCKTEAQVEARDALPNSSQDISALSLNQFGEGSALASGDPPGGTDVSGACSSKQHIRLGCSHRGLVPAGAGKLQQHLDLEHPASGPRRCSEHTSTSGSELQHHIYAIHSEEKPFQCSECDYACTAKRYLKSHFLLKHSTEKPFRCSDCEYSCTIKQNLKNHFLSKHSIEKPFKCSECDYACTLKGNLKKHVLHKHSRRKTIQCSECDYACSSKEYLKSHWLHKHSTEKPFQCSECDYACTTKAHLERHVLNKHSTKKPCQCSECVYACTTKVNLKRHFLRKHSREKPIQGS
ncbi:zinc finger protein 425-like, partial [Hyalella azteca]|uniref:Zinc finger protein 425-like n=1 Tax=Hyalella azteca TaxID=294128 RepID=A0A979FHU7_HYAAZ